MRSSEPRNLLTIVALVAALAVPSVAEASCQKCVYIWLNGWFCEEVAEGQQGWTTCISTASTCSVSGVCVGERQPFEKTLAPLVLVDRETERPDDVVIEVAASWRRDG